MLKTGQVIGGKYKVIHQAGKGGMSRVYLVINEEVNREWAIKEIRKEEVLKPEYGGDGTTPVVQKVRGDATSESQIMARLRNPHLPRITEVLETNDSYLIVMDYIEGRTLKAMLDDGAMTQEETVDIALQMCEALEYLHNLTPRVIYRDMKPDNIMQKPDGTCVLIDFGISREYKEGNEQKTQDTTCLGTKGYAPPEQYGGGNGQTDPRSDIFALGATMYHLVTGKDPSKPPYEMRPIRKWNPALSSGLEAIIVKCTQNDPEKRYQDIPQLRTALLHYRELDRGYQRMKNRQLVQCAVFLLSGILCIAGGMFCGARAKSLKKGTYMDYMQEARIAVTKEDRVRGYRLAVETDPSKADAYEGLLSEYISDMEFTKEEAEELTQILGYRGKESAQTAETMFRRESPEGYDSFCYDLGLVYFYYYGSEGNKPLSRPWFGQAKDSRTLDPQKAKRAERFYSIADYYTNLGKYDKAGDSTVSYADYWNDLVVLSSGNIIQEDNAMTALVVYEDMSYQIAVHADDFRRAGVGYEDLASELEMIKANITPYTEPSQKDTQEAMIAGSILANIEKALQAMDAAYQEMEE